MNKWVVYEVATGQIVSIVECAEGHMCVGEGQAFFEGSADPQLQYVHDGALAPRADYPLSHLPVPCDVWIDGVRYHCTEQPEFEFDVPGEYVIYVNAGPRFLEKEFRYAHQP